MADSIVEDELWEDFHTVVNMTSRELRDWLAVQGAGETTEEVPDQAGPEIGHRVLDILAKRKADVTEDDVAVMNRVIDDVVDKRGEDLEGLITDDGERRRLMDIGHDALKP